MFEEVARRGEGLRLACLVDGERRRVRRMEGVKVMRLRMEMERWREGREGGQLGFPFG